MTIFSHPIGNSNVWHAALALEEAGLLERVFTCIRWNPDAPLSSLVRGRLRAQLARRAFPAPVRPKLDVSPWLEWGRVLSTKLGFDSLSRHEHGIFSVDGVYRGLDERVARALRSGAMPGAKAVYSYEDGARETFTAARERGLRCLYDLPIGYWRAAQDIYHDEAVREPEWMPTLDGIYDSSAKLQKKERELLTADEVFVASRFTASTLQRAPGFAAPVHVVPYGAPAPLPEQRRPDGPLRVLFVGTLTQRKGLSHALRAVERLGRGIEFTLVGSRLRGECAPLDAALRRHRWIPTLPAEEVLATMCQHDVMLFPSLFEGFGLVILEALACGLPVITTPHTGGPDVLTDGEDGFIVPVRDVDAMADRLDRLATRRELCREMSAAARRKAARLDWSVYRTGLAQAVRQCLASPPAAV
ncbi:MAG: glycosyltransferase family 4 protein [Verrucomicrobia bacterium]|nr:glycosyltransferase family 4 protein [Verrucomicrobiota bacterium]